MADDRSSLPSSTPASPEPPAPLQEPIPIQTPVRADSMHITWVPKPPNLSPARTQDDTVLNILPPRPMTELSDVSHSGGSYPYAVEPETRPSSAFSFFRWSPKRRSKRGSNSARLSQVDGG